MTKNKLDKLEAVRGWAAFYVMLGHLELYKLHWSGYLLTQGQAVVMLFFVLSGFVIYYSVQRSPDITFSNYFLKRFKRIYPIFLVALLIAYLGRCLAFGNWVDPQWTQLVGNLLNLQDLNRHPGVWFEIYQVNTPLWSLAYEWWFYMLFYFLYKKISFKNQRLGALVISMLGYISFEFIPNPLSLYASYFIIWWMGVELARWWLSKEPLAWKHLSFIILSYVSMLALMGVNLLYYHFLLKKSLLFSFHPIIEIWHLLASGIFILLGLIWWKYRFIAFNYILRPFAILAPISYALYVAHFPIIKAYGEHGELNTFHLYGHPLALIAIKLVCILLLSYLLEIIYQPIANRAIDWLAKINSRKAT